MQNKKKAFSSCLFQTSWSVVWYPYFLCCGEPRIISPVPLLTAQPITRTSSRMKTLSPCNLSTCRAIPQALSFPPLSASFLVSRVFFCLFFPLQWREEICKQYLSSRWIIDLRNDKLISSVLFNTFSLKISTLNLLFRLSQITEAMFS